MNVQRMFGWLLLALGYYDDPCPLTFFVELEVDWYWLRHLVHSYMHAHRNTRFNSSLSSRSVEHKILIQFTCWFGVWVQRWMYTLPPSSRPSYHARTTSSLALVSSSHVSDIIFPFPELQIPCFTLTAHESLKWYCVNICAACSERGWREHPSRSTASPRNMSTCMIRMCNSTSRSDGWSWLQNVTPFRAYLVFHSYLANDCILKIPGREIPCEWVFEWYFRSAEGFNGCTIFWSRCFSDNREKLWHR